MDEYSFNSSCKKCGCLSIAVKYNFKPDLIERTCVRCGYSWNEESFEKDANKEV